MAHIGLVIQLDVKTSSLISPSIFYTVAAVFSLAHKLQPAIIFIDEVDSFLGQRKSTDNEASTNMKTEFMALWDGFTTDRRCTPFEMILYLVAFITVKYIATYPQEIMQFEIVVFYLVNDLTKEGLVTLFTVVMFM